MNGLNYQHLRYFWSVAHEGGVTAAAQRLNVSQSSVSVQLKKLEDRLEHALFERVGKRLVLTEAGRIALDYADTVFAAGEELLSTLRDRPVDRRRPLRVGAIPTLSRNFQLAFLEPIVGRTDVELTVRSGAFLELLSLLETHELDVVLTNRAAPRDGRARFRNRLLNEQPVALVGRPAARPRPFRFPDDLRDAPVLLPSADSEIRQAFDAALERAGVVPTILAEVDDMAMLRLLARESDGLTLAPLIVVRDELDAGVLEEVCRAPGASERFYAVTLDRRFPNPLLADLFVAPDASAAL